MRRRLFALAAVALFAFTEGAAAQNAPDDQESALQAEFRREREHIAESCGSFSVKSIGGCAIALVTEQPVHVALGSLAPQNGFAFGAAFVTHHTPNEQWRLGFNADGVAAPGGSWRAGAYTKIVRTAVEGPRVVRTPGSTSGGGLGIRPYPVLDLYAQAISLDKLFFYGPAAGSTLDDRTVFGMSQTIVGTTATIPIPRLSGVAALRPSLVAAVNGRFVAVRGNDSESSPSIERRYTEADAPGLNEQPAFAQFGEGVRLLPSWLGGRLQPDYLINFQQFVAKSSAHVSFRRWTVDLNHAIPLYSTARSAASQDTNGPDDCSMTLGSAVCPSVSRNRGGTIGLRLMASGSTAFSDSVVPFYFQHTLGGSDINGNRALSAYDDYRFRGPHLMLAQESIEHSLWGPLGVSLLAEQGKVTQRQGDLNFSGLAHSYAAGLTVRAAGVPQLSLSYAWGSGEGHHIIATMGTSLLGGGSRPSLD